MSMGARFSRQAIAGLVLICAGSVVYATQEKQPDAAGLGYLALNVLCSTVSPLLEKRFATHLLSSQTPSGMALYRNINSVPILLVLIAWSAPEGLASVGSLSRLGGRERAALGLTALLSFTMGWAVFSLQTRVTATSIVAANNWYKLLTLLASLLLWATPFRPLGWLGIAINFAGLFWYSYEQARPRPPPPPAQHLPMVEEEQDRPPGQP
jgi:drug/metabolite transporter (DMT)-like permease